MSTVCITQYVAAIIWKGYQYFQAHWPLSTLSNLKSPKQLKKNYKIAPSCATLSILDYVKFVGIGKHSRFQEFEVF